jgi:hypothetical protein
MEEMTFIQRLSNSLSPLLTRIREERVDFCGKEM